MEPRIAKIFDAYPEKATFVLMQCRQAVFDIAQEYELGAVEETLKWGEPSYFVKGGSAVRMNWKPNQPDCCFVFFHCQTKLVSTFREVYGDLFEYQGKRAIALRLDAPIPLDQLKHCLSLAMRYHSIKHLPLLGC
ncbi:DUF1801 domain-containing protein [Marinomonas balearica]|uniref:Uncharacterized protein DUF1801 n=1 Tax=Marinomonas balearica TaxID=491947 RepID=A0A4R6M273_9GAMM|nr:DUF1801 domain-containing protein [Marinomonas balearica]TDO95347.1 uncharacterized protein DUF1801 [Marinomonas balearica]